MDAHECPRLQPVLISHNEFQSSVHGDESPVCVNRSPDAFSCRRTGLYLRLRDAAEFVQLREKPHNPLTERLNTTAFGLVKHSERTELFLRQTGYQGGDDLKLMIRHAATHRAGKHYYEATHSLSELNYLAAEVVKTRDPQLASELYLDSSKAAWRYFATQDTSGEQPDPGRSEHRSTAEVYNAASEVLLRISNGLGKMKLGQSMQMPLTYRRLLFDIPFPSNLLTPEQLSEFEFVSDYELKNLKSRHATQGLGVPIIAIRRESQVRIRF